jgi:hypothetical protein
MYKVHQSKLGNIQIICMYSDVIIQIGQVIRRKNKSIGLTLVTKRKIIN